MFFELLTVVLFVWLLVKTVGLMLRLAWGAAKIAAGVLIALALPLLIVCLLFVGGAALLAPIVLLVIAAGILKACVH